MANRTIEPRFRAFSLLTPVLLLLAPACSRPQEDDPRAQFERARQPDVAEAEPYQGDLSRLSATSLGKPLQLKSAAAWGRSGRTIRLTFSTATPTCDDHLASFRALAPGERTIIVVLAPVLQRDGSERWSILRIAADNFTREGPGLGIVTLSDASVDEVVKGELAFEFDLPGDDMDAEPLGKLVVKGSFEAKGCGRRELRAAPPPPARPQNDLTIRVDGMKKPIQGAVVRPTRFPKPGHEVVLSSAPSDCGRERDAGDVVLTVLIGDGSRVEYLDAEGDIFPNGIHVSTPANEPSIVAKPRADLSAGSGEVVIDLSGQIAHPQYPISASGSVSAIRCPAT